MILNPPHTFTINFSFYIYNSFPNCRMHFPCISRCMSVCMCVSVSLPPSLAERRFRSPSGPAEPISIPVGSFEAHPAQPSHGLPISKPIRPSRADFEAQSAQLSRIELCCMFVVISLVYMCRCIFVRLLSTSFVRPRSPKG